MEIKQSLNKENWKSHIEIVGLVAHESDFGRLRGMGRDCFEGDYCGRKVLSLSDRPSAKWVRAFNMRTQSKDKATYNYKWNTVLLQPNQNKLFFLCKNNEVWVCLNYLTSLFESINKSIKNNKEVVLNESGGVKSDNIKNNEHLNSVKEFLSSQTKIAVI
ncbi:hypothetical protein ABRQ03_03470 [Pectobacterium jejuense]|uniref:hypothetical protein n=1 Tax=Pectobacterium jejuense TaxID=2974022 RepID=UPI0032EBF16C